MPPLAEHHNNFMATCWEEQADQASKECISTHKTNFTACEHPRKPQRSVSFASKCKMRMIPHINDFEHDDIESIYLQPTDYERIKRDLYQSLDRITQGKYNSNADCFRGLEVHTTYGAAYRRNNRRMAYDAVLDEQEMQWYEGIRSEEYIAMSYLEHTYRCQQEAQLRGDEDATDAVAAEATVKSADKPPKVAFRRHSTITRTV